MELVAYNIPGAVNNFIPRDTMLEMARRSGCDTARRAPTTRTTLST